MAINKSIKLLGQSLRDINYGEFSTEIKKNAPYVIQTSANPLTQNIPAETGTILTRTNSPQVFFRTNTGWLELSLKTSSVNLSTIGDINSFIGRVNNAKFPTYSSTNIITQNDNLTKAISTLDQESKNLSDRIDQISLHTNHNDLNNIDGGNVSTKYYGHNTELMQTRQENAGNANGYAILGPDGKLPLENLPPVTQTKFVVYTGISGETEFSFTNPAASTDITYNTFDVLTNQLIGLSLVITNSTISCSDIRQITSNNQIKVVIN